MFGLSLSARCLLPKMFLDRYSKRGGYVKLQGGKAVSCLRLRIYFYDPRSPVVVLLVS